MLAKVNKNDERKDWFLLSRVFFFVFVYYLFVCLFIV